MSENPLPTGGDPRRVRYEKWIIIMLIIIVGMPLYLLVSPPAWLRNMNPTIQPGKDIGDPIIGPADAPVKIIMYNEFACVKCREWHLSGVLDQVLEKYGDQVAFVWRDLPRASRFSTKASEAAQCANEQGKFWEYHDYLYESAEGFMDEKLYEYSAILGLDTKQFDRCYYGGVYRSKVMVSRNEAYDENITASPTFLINGERIVGVASFEALSRVIDEKLKEIAISGG